MTQPAPAEGESQLLDAVYALVDILDSLPSFEPCRGPVESWPEDVRHRRAPAWDLWSPEFRRELGPKFKESWSMYGDGWLVAYGPSIGMRIQRVRGSQTEAMQPAIRRAMKAGANSVPSTIGTMLSETWGRLPPPSPKEGGVILRNDWHERRVAVNRVRGDIDRLLPAATRAVKRAGGDSTVLQQLQKDEFLNHETVDDAVAQLRRGLPAETSEPGMTPPHKGTKAMMTGREAAEFLGTTEGTLSRWRNATPAWASSNPRLFGHLISRDAGRYSKMNIHLLGRWFAQAQERGLQTPTDCP